MTVGDRLKKAMKARGVRNNAELARRTKLSRAGVGLIANDITKDPSGETLMAVTQALQIRARWLLYGEEPMDLSPDEADDSLSGKPHNNRAVSNEERMQRNELLSMFDRLDRAGRDHVLNDARAQIALLEKIEEESRRPFAKKSAP